MNDRLVLQGILFVLITGIGWEDLPQELGFGSGMTCWRRLRDWQTAGVFEAMHTAILAHCHRAGLIDFGRVIPDGSHVRAPRRGTRDKATAGRWIVEQTLALLHQYRRWPPVGNGAPTSIKDFSTSPPH